MQCLKYLLATALCWTYMKAPMVDTEIKICFYPVENYINSLFDLEQIDAILDFIHNPVSKVLSCHTTMSEIHKNT